MADSWKEEWKPPIGGPLVGFTGHNLWLLGTIHLPLILVYYDGKESRTQTIEFSVICNPTEQNILLGRLTLFELQPVPSTIHSTLKFGTQSESVTIVADNPHRWTCHQT